jgi:hypothetical protein
MRHTIARFTLLSLFAFAAVACDDDDDPVGIDGVAQLRVVNAADIEDVQARRVGSPTPLAQNLDFRGSTLTCVEVPAGEQALVFSQLGQELAVAAATFEAGESYTAFLVASGVRTRAFIVADDETASPGNNALRFVNATSTDGDVYVTAPGGPLTASFRAHAPLGAHALSNQLPAYVHRGIDHTQVRLFNAGTTAGTPRADFALTGLPASRLASVVFTEGTPTAFMITPCP